MGLRKEPTWEIFTEDFQLTDQFGSKIQGRDAIEAMLKFLHWTIQKFPTKEDIQLDFNSSAPFAGNLGR